jgi:HSP20 family protein
MGKMAEQINRGYYSFYPSETWTPAVNLYETETAYLVCVDLAGVDRDRIELAVHDNRLKLRGTRNVPSNAELPETNLRGRRVRLHLMEIDHGAFCREVELPEDVCHDKISANYRDGLLWVELPKKR